MKTVKKAIICVLAATMLSAVFALSAYGEDRNFNRRAVGGGTYIDYPLGGTMQSGMNGDYKSCFSNYHHPSKLHYSRAACVTNYTGAVTSRVMGAGSWSYATLYRSFDRNSILYYHAFTK